MRPIHLNDEVYGGDEVRKHRELIIQLRDSALKSNQFTWAIILSINIGLLHELAKELDNDISTD